MHKNSQGIAVILPIVFILLVFGVVGYIIYKGQTITKQDKITQVPSPLATTLPVQPTKTIVPTDFLSPTPTQINMKIDDNRKISFESCTAPYYNEFYTIAKSDVSGKCNLQSSWGNFSFNYPKGWSVRPAGAGGTNFMFNEEDWFESNEKLFIVKMTANNSLEDADKEVYRFEAASDPLVNTSEATISKNIVNIGSHEVLTLVTNNDENTIHRYFLHSSGDNTDKVSLFMFEFDESNKTLNSNVIDIISSLTF